MRKLILIKLGGSLITDKTKPYTEKPAVIKRLVKEIHQAKKQSRKLIIVGHGGGSYPHVSALKYQTSKGAINQKSPRGIAEVQNDASRLNRIITKAFLKAGESAISFNPSSFLITKNRKITSFFLSPILKILEFNMLPIVFGDVGLDLEIGCCILSTETILNFLAKNLPSSHLRGGRMDSSEVKYVIEKIIFAGTTKGVLDKSKKTIKLINRSKFKKIKPHLKGSHGIDVTGGMLHKVKESLKLAKLGIETVIINGQKPGNLKKAILGQKVTCTRVIPDSDPGSMQ